MKNILATCMSLTITMMLFSTETEARYASINVNLAMNVSEDSHQLSEDMVYICAQETDISMEELHKMRQQDFKDSTEATQCFVHCIHEQMGLIRYGVFVKRDLIRMLADVTDPQALAMYNECYGLKGGNKCETAYKIHQCQREHEHKNGAKVPPIVAIAGHTGGAQATSSGAAEMH